MKSIAELEHEGAERLRREEALNPQGGFNNLGLRIQNALRLKREEAALRKQQKSAIEAKHKAAILSQNKANELKQQKAEAIAELKYKAAERLKEEEALNPQGGFNNLGLRIQNALRLKNEEDALRKQQNAAIVPNKVILTENNKQIESVKGTKIRGISKGMSFKSLMTLFIQRTSGGPAGLVRPSTQQLNSDWQAYIKYWRELNPKILITISNDNAYPFNNNNTVIIHGHKVNRGYLFKDHSIGHPSLSGNAIISCQNYNKSSPPITKLYSGIEWIGYEADNLPNGFMSYFGTTLKVTSDGIYTVYMSADDQGTLYINGKRIGDTNVSNSWQQVNEYRVKLNKGIYGITVSVKNDCPKCEQIHMEGILANQYNGCSNPSSLALFIKDPAGKIVLQTNTDWKASSSLINYNTLQGVVVARKEAVLHNQQELVKEVASRNKKESEIEIALHKKQDLLYAAISSKHHVVPNKEYNKNTCVNLSSGIGCNKTNKALENKPTEKNKVAVVKKSELTSSVSNKNKYIYKSGEGIVKSTSSILTSGEGEVNKINTVAVKNTSSVHTLGEGAYKEPNNLINIENKHSSIESTTSKGNKFLDDIKKYWWIGLLVVGHVI